MTKKLNISHLFTAIVILLSQGIFSFAQIQAVNAQPSSFSNSNIHSGENLNDPYESKFFRVDGNANLSVLTINGDIDVVYNPSIRGVQVDLYVKREFSLWAGSRSLDNYRIIIQQQGNRIVASVEDKRPGGRNRSEQNVEFSFVIQVPQNGEMSLRTSNGNILLDGVNGEHFIQNHTGVIRVKRSEGTIRVASSAGNIELDDSKGNLYAKSMSGNVISRNHSGEIRLRTVSGDIETSGTEGVMVAASVSGNINAAFNDVSRGVYMETISGNIDLLLPHFRGFDITAAGMRYNFDGLDDAQTVKQVRSGKATVKIREGGIPVNISTVAGRVSVNESQYNK
jgi:DUF4097 and DUF4098 domain-containing protein YvlB